MVSRMSEEEFNEKLTEFIESIWDIVEGMDDEAQEQFIYECISDSEFLRNHFRDEAFRTL